MNRIDRLMAMLLLLQGGKHTAPELATRFAISRRTVVRDIAALCEMGVPVITELGAQGGYSLPPDYSLPPLALTFHEALLLRLALSALAQLPQLPFKEQRESMLAKVQTLLPKRYHPALEAVQQTILLHVPDHGPATPFLEMLQCAQTEQWIEVAYQSERGPSSQQLLPLRLRSSAGLVVLRGLLAAAAAKPYLQG